MNQNWVSTKLEGFSGVVDKNNSLTTNVKMNGMMKVFIIDTGSPIYVMMTDNGRMKEGDMQKIINRHKLVKLEMKLRRKTGTSRIRKQQTNEADFNHWRKWYITALLRMCWLTNFKPLIENIGLDESNELSTIPGPIRKQHYWTIKTDAERNIELKPGLYASETSRRILFFVSQLVIVKTLNWWTLH